MTNPVVAVLGTGTMGAGMVRSLRRAGLPVRMWNRDAAKARALTDTGAEACDSPAEAVAGADVVLTMLFDADAAIDVVRRAGAAGRHPLAAVQHRGPRGRRRTAEVAAELGLVLVDCPVLGTKQPAEKGALVCSPPARRTSRERARPGVRRPRRQDPVARRGGGGQPAEDGLQRLVVHGHRRRRAVDRAGPRPGRRPAGLPRRHRGRPAGHPLRPRQGRAMIAGDFPVSFGLTGAAKDARLIQEALRSAGLSDRLDAAVLETMDAAAAALDDPAPPTSAP